VNKAGGEGLDGRFDLRHVRGQVPADLQQHLCWLLPHPPIILRFKAGISSDNQEVQFALPPKSQRMNE
jgi:hypothetical protein